MLRETYSFHQLAQYADNSRTHQIETKMKKWKFRKNIDKEIWKSIDCHITKRKYDRKESEVILRGKRMKAETVTRETDRYGDRSTLTCLALRKHRFRLSLVDIRTNIEEYKEIHHLYR